MSGTLAGTGTFRCATCDYVLSLAAADRMPPCPSCGGIEFVRASLFTAQQPTRTAIDLSPEDSLEWLEDARAALDQAGQYLIYDGGGGEPVVHELSREWTRVGRSLAADVRFDDPTVSRRHALIVRQADGVRVLDDRSLNGVFVNSERIEWRALADGDELLVGRHRLHFVDLPAVGDEGDARTERVPAPLAG
jgi:pSer/pThr/pTyr-binding forkhead associated (FHA) protein/predicted RNA-binding Zn-ribbon protein involved in translation (DUF1610 family)